MSQGDMSLRESKLEQGTRQKSWASAVAKASVRLMPLLL